MRPLFGVCPACRKYGLLTRHHIFPKRKFGGVRNDAIITLCQACHSSLDNLLTRNPSRDECVTLLRYILGVEFNERL